MGFRTVIVQKRSKLDLKLNYMVCRGENEVKVYIPEISVLILESTAISLTSALISQLIKNNVKIIFCDEKHNPESEVVGYHEHYMSSKRIKNQIQWKEEIKGEIWQEIVKEKIKKQKDFLIEQNFLQEAKLLSEYISQVDFNDCSNREGHAAKVYFNALWGVNFCRRNNSWTNIALNYGYSILLSLFNREIAKNGYIAQIGIWHKNEFNPYNLASDLMEPFRILIDRAVYLETKEATWKDTVLNILKKQVVINNKSQYLDNAIAEYCLSVFDSLESGNIKIKFYV